MSHTKKVIAHGGPAYPMEKDAAESLSMVSETDDNGRLMHGMTLRQHYAGLAMQGILASPYSGKEPAYLAKNAFKIADAMLKEGEA